MRRGFRKNLTRRRSREENSPLCPESTGSTIRSIRTAADTPQRLASVRPDVSQPAFEFDPECQLWPAQKQRLLPSAHHLNT